MKSGQPGVVVPASLKAIVFDVDGTLYRQGPVRRGMTIRLLREFLRNPSSAWKTAAFLRAFRNAQEELRRESGADVARAQLRLACHRSGMEAAAARECIRAWFEEGPLDLVARSIRPGARQFLQAASESGLRLGVFSDYPVRQKIEVLGVAKYFDCLRYAQQLDVGEFKPSPKGIRLTLESLGVGAGEAIYVGDRPSIDGEAARRAGVSAVIIGMPPGSAGAGWIGVPGFPELGSLLGFAAGR